MISDISGGYNNQPVDLHSVKSGLETKIVRALEIFDDLQSRQMALTDEFVQFKTGAMMQKVDQRQFDDFRAFTERKLYD